MERRKRFMFNQRNGTFRLGMLIAVVAGLWTIVHLIWNVVGVKADDYWGWALLILFILALISAFVQYAQERQRLFLRLSRFPNLRSRSFSLVQKALLYCGSSFECTLVPSGFLPGGKRLFLPPGEQAEKHWQDLPLVR